MSNIYTYVYQLALRLIDLTGRNLNRRRWKFEKKIYIYRAKKRGGMITTQMEKDFETSCAIYNNGIAIYRRGNFPPLFLRFSRSGNALWQSLFPRKRLAWFRKNYARVSETRSGRGARVNFLSSVVYNVQPSVFSRILKWFTARFSIYTADALAKWQRMHGSSLFTGENNTRPSRATLNTLCTHSCP